MRADGTRAEQSDEAPKPRPANTAYERYKQELHKFFSGEKPLPDHLRDMLSTRPGAAEHGFAKEEGEEVVADKPEKQDDAAKKGKRQNGAKAKAADDGKKQRRVVNGPTDEVLALIEAVRKASSPREVESAVDALRAKGAALPKDADILSKALGHSSEDVLIEAMQGLVDVDQSSIKSPTLLKTRVKNVLLLASRVELKELCQKVLARL